MPENDAMELLAAAKGAAKAVAAWSDAVAEFMLAEERHKEALEEARTLEDARDSYASSRNIDDDEGGFSRPSSFRANFSSSMAIMRASATTLQEKRSAGEKVNATKAAAEEALKRADGILKTTGTS
jgi:biopolymer transport protein ExbB/TolQ